MWQHAADVCSACVRIFQFDRSSILGFRNSCSVSHASPLLDIAHNPVHSCSRRHWAAISHLTWLYHPMGCLRSKAFTQAWSYEVYGGAAAAEAAGFRLPPPEQLAMHLDWPTWQLYVQQLAELLQKEDINEVRPVT